MRAGSLSQECLRQIAQHSNEIVRHLQGSLKPEIQAWIQLSTEVQLPNSSYWTNYRPVNVRIMPFEIFLHFTMSLTCFLSLSLL